MVTDKKRSALKLILEPGRSQQPRTRKRNKGDGGLDDKSGNKICLHYSRGLKERLLKDKEMIMSQRYLVTIPAKYSCETVLKEFLLFEKEENSVFLNNGVTFDMVNGLRGYFNYLMREELLYKPEVHQSKKIDAGKTPYSELYGCEHLLRMCTCIGKLIPNNEFDDYSFRVLQAHMQRLVDFIDTKKDKYLTNENYTCIQ